MTLLFQDAVDSQTDLCGMHFDANSWHFMGKKNLVTLFFLF